MNKLFKFVITGLFLLLPDIVLADKQIADNPLNLPAPFRVSFNSLANAEFDEDSINNIDFSVNEVELSGTFSAFNVSGGRLILAGEFRYTEYQFDSSQIDDNQLYEIAMPMTYVTGNDDLRHIVRVSPGINSDFENLTADDFTLSAIYQAKFKTSQTLTWVLGAGVSHQFGDSQAFPLFGAIYQPNKLWRFNLVLPQLEATYSTAEGNLWYFSLTPAGRSWNVEQENKSTDVDIVTEEIRLALGGVYGVNENLAIRFEIGSAVGRNLEFSLSNGDEVDLDVEDTSFVGISLEYRL